MNLFRLRCRLSAFLQDTNLGCSRLLHYLSLQIVSYRLFSVLFFSKSYFYTVFNESYSMHVLCSMTYWQYDIVHRYYFGWQWCWWCSEYIKSVTNISNLSPTYLVSNIRHQNRCNRILIVDNACSTAIPLEPSGSNSNLFFTSADIAVNIEVVSSWVFGLTITYIKVKYTYDISYVENLWHGCGVYLLYKL